MAPVLDLDRWYKAGDEEYLVGGISGHASAGWISSSPILMQVPALEVWHVHQFGWNVVLSEGRQLIFSPGTRVNEGTILGSGFPLVDRPIDITAPAPVGTYTYTGGTDWGGFGKFFRQGTIFGTWITLIAAATDFNYNLRFTRMRRG